MIIQTTRILRCAVTEFDRQPIALVEHGSVGQHRAGEPGTEKWPARRGSATTYVAAHEQSGSAAQIAR